MKHQLTPRCAPSSLLHHDHTSSSPGRKTGSVVCAPEWRVMLVAARSIAGGHVTSRHTVCRRYVASRGMLREPGASRPQRALQRHQAPSARLAVRGLATLEG
eukprot:2209538-Prymnesium_polylepis.1